MFILGIALPFSSFSQSDSLLWELRRERLVLPRHDSIFADSLAVYPPSLSFRNLAGDTVYPGYIFHRRPVSWLELSERHSDTLILSYRVLEFPLHQRFQHKDTSLLLPDEQAFSAPNYQAADNNEFKPFRGLTSAGSISRGISVGNNQDAVLNSDLNLQLSGNISPSTTLRASITDNNIPVQSDGYTQQLREFDRVYMELENPDFGLLRAGDYSMSNAGHRFLQFDKRISGAGIFTNFPAGDNLMPLQLQGGIARGRFARNRFMAGEGNQGPYKLRGNNNEQYIIIISGSERVYVDGILMKRGQQYDYTIDYNAGEITFTALQPMTRERRVVVEFQYTEQNYLRSVFFGSGGLVSDNINTSVQYYSEQDSKNQPLLQDLSNDDKQVLSAAGDRLNQAVVSTISPSAFADDRVLYELRDSLGYDSVLVYSVDSSRQLYQASFAPVGNNRGNYRLDRNDANGRVFRWIAPINGVPQGNYSPVRQLVAPNRLQILSLQSQASIGEKHQLRLELAASKNDLNLFSDLDEADDEGGAGSLSYAFSDSLAQGLLSAGVNYEFNQNNFTTIERIRRVEFARDWNLPLNYNEGLQLAGVNLGFSQHNWQLGTTTDWLQANDFSGFKNALNFKLKNNKQLLRLGLSLLNASDSASRSRFAREQGEYRLMLTEKWWTGLRSQGEWNQQRAAAGDTLLARSYNFIEYEVFSGVGDSAGNFSEISYMERYDDTARLGEMQQFARARAYRLRTSLKTSFNSQLQAAVNLRQLKRLQAEEQPLEKTTTLRLNYLQRFFKNAITSSSFYETGSGTEARRSFSYVEVPPGTGTYTHTDYNGNGIKELSEFEVAPTPDLARYIRIFAPTNEYVRTSIQKFSETLSINAPNSWASQDNWKAVSRRFSLLLNYQLDRKTLLQGYANTINPFKEVADDSLIVALNNNFRSSLFFNRSSTHFGGHYTYRKTDNRNLLSFGVEQRQVEEHELSGRYQIAEPLLAQAEASWQDKRNISGNFESRNFSIDQLSNRYSLSYQTSLSFILSASYAWDQQLSSGEISNQLFSQKAGLELKYNNAEKISAQLNLNYIKNDFEGERNSPAGFEMLRELRPGDNGTWGLILQRSIRKNILLSLNYSGRVSPGVRPIHNGNLEVKAFF